MSPKAIRLSLGRCFPKGSLSRQQKRSTDQSCFSVSAPDVRRRRQSYPLYCILAFGSYRKLSKTYSGRKRGGRKRNVWVGKERAPARDQGPKANFVQPPDGIGASFRWHRKRKLFSVTFSIVEHEYSRNRLEARFPSEPVTELETTSLHKHLPRPRLRRRRVSWARDRNRTQRDSQYFFSMSLTVNPNVSRYKLRAALFDRLTCSET